MKKITIIITLFAGTSLFGQNGSLNSKIPRYRIHLTTMNDNMLKGLLIDVKDSSLVVYPGKRKEWRSKARYAPVEFNYTNIQLVKLKKKNGAWRGMLIGGGVGISVFTASVLLHNGSDKGEVFFYTFPSIPLGFIAGAIISGKNRKKFHIQGCRPIFNEFQKRIQ
ncbi:MAG: hypothetical protein WDO71_09875 [Bacteroidota bacterium]